MKGSKEKQLKKHLGFNIACARLDRKITQAKLAEMVKTKQPNIARAERNGCEIGFALKCLEAMGFTLDQNAMRAVDPNKVGLVFQN